MFQKDECLAYTDYVYSTAVILFLKKSLCCWCISRLYEPEEVEKQYVGYSDG